VYCLENDRPQHAHFDSDSINIYHKTTSFSHGQRSQGIRAGFGSSRNWAKQDLGLAGIGPSRNWAK